MNSADKERGSQVHRNPAFGAAPHPDDCMCVLCWYDNDECHCWICTNARWFFWPKPEPKRVLVPTDETARHLARLGWTQRQVASVSGLSLGVVNKASSPGRRVDKRTAERLLALEPVRMVA